MPQLSEVIEYRELERRNLKTSGINYISAHLAVLHFKSNLFSNSIQSNPDKPLSDKSVLIFNTKRPSDYFKQDKIYYALKQYCDLKLNN